ncbi:MAG: hypothetical protein JWN86_4025 [Planctomycetota bacterium]|nr:hypothetical protein [Planctomycetota bacterium]
MQVTIAHENRPQHAASDPSKFRHLSEVIEHATHLLPAQGPITVFIHHNTLHAFEELPFFEAVEKGARTFGCQPYLSLDRYRDELVKGRIRFTELQEVLEKDLGSRGEEPVPCFGARRELWLAMLQYPLRTGPTEELVWYVAEANALRRVRSEVSSAARGRLIAETRRWVIRELRGGIDSTQNDGSRTKRRADRKMSKGLAQLLDRFGESRIENWSKDDWEGFTLQALWRVCCDGVRDLPPYTPPPAPASRHRDVILEATGIDTDSLVHELLIRYSAAFLDQGMAPWSLPRRDEGFYRAFCSLYRSPTGPTEQWMKGLPAELGRLEDEAVSPLQCIAESLTYLGVAESEWEHFLSATLLALRGWGGMVQQIEERGDRTVRPIPPGSLVEFLAVRLLLDRFALIYTARTALGITSPVSSFWRLARGRIDGHWPPSVEQRAFLVFQLAQVHGLSPDVLFKLGTAEWASLMEEIETFSDLERRRIFHLAYEQRFYTQTLDAIALHAPAQAEGPRKPRFQAMFCIDEREESIRRHLEELAPDAVTFSTAGFFSIAMYFRGAADAHFVPLCPAVIRPQHWVVEEAVEKGESAYKLRIKVRRAFGHATHRIHLGSRSFVAGAVLAAVGVLASVPLIARTLFPRLTSRVRRRFGGFVLSSPTTRLRLERAEATPGPDGGHVGFTLDEMIGIAEKVLRETGLTSEFSRLVLIIGHGSTSMNNPHESAHDCGACGGARGGPNGRALAQMLNDRRVRDGLAERGLFVTEETSFVGGMHNTSSDTVTFYDLDLVPESHRAEFEAVAADVERACDRDAHERSRRFLSAPLSLSFPAARQGVEARAEDLAQVRPEWGHATNAVSIVGHRDWTRGLFLDRRSFLTSYDPRQDDAETTVLKRILSAVIPVCAGISLEYYFSYVDNTGWGSGTKLPHNITSLLGVMDGAASDLRTGLPWQMVEIHEPVRLLFLIETTPDAMLRIMDQNPTIGRLCRNGWIKLAVIDPTTRRVSVFEDQAFRAYHPQTSVLPKADSSVDWYRGWRDHLEFAEIGA